MGNDGTESGVLSASVIGAYRGWNRAVGGKEQERKRSEAKSAVRNNRDRGQTAEESTDVCFRTIVIVRPRVPDEWISISQESNRNAKAAHRMILSADS